MADAAVVVWELCVAVWAQVCRLFDSQFGMDFMVIAFLQFRFTWNIKIWKITTKSTTLAKKHTYG